MKGETKFHKVLSEMKSGTLHSSSGPKVTNPKQALAIAYSEARRENPHFGAHGAIGRRLRHRGK